MKKIIFLSIFIPSVLFSQWVNQQIPPGVGILITIDFVNSSTGVSAGWVFGGPQEIEGRCLYTSNGGINWQFAAMPDSTRSLVTVQMINLTTGYSAAAYNIIGKQSRFVPQKKYYYSKSKPIGFNFYDRDTVLGTRGFFLKTTNSGHNWFPYGNFAQTVFYLNGMYFINETTGFVSAQATLIYWGGREVIHKTTNGGMNWILSYSQANTESIRNIYFVNNNTGFAVGYARIDDPVYPIQGTIIVTTNGGSNWSRQLFYYVNNFTDVTMANSNTGFASGVSNSDTIFRGIIYKTTNSGQNWFKLNYQLDTSIFDGIEFFPGTGTGFCYGTEDQADTAFPGWYYIEHNVIIKTTDYGNTWQTHFIDDPNNILVASKMLSLTNWYISGGDFYEAKILHTTNGGAIGIQPISSEITNQFSLLQNYPNPFNPTTRIKFDIPPSKGAGGMITTLAIYDALGKEIAVLVNERLSPGTYEVTWDASSYPSGVYFYQLSINNEQLATKKMVLVK